MTLTAGGPAGRRVRIGGPLVIAALLVAGCSGVAPSAGSIAADPTAADTSAVITGGSTPGSSAGSSSGANGSPSAAASPADPSGCAVTPAADTATADGWIGYLAAHPDQVAVLVDDGRGASVTHRATAAQPTASAAKVIHLAAYGQAVDSGAIDPDQPVTVGEWEQWYLPGLDGGAHPAALGELGVPLDPTGRYAADPAATVTIDDLVGAMIRFSDNAATDLLRDRLGDEALLAVLDAAGSTADPDTSGAATPAAPPLKPAALPSFLGDQIVLLEGRPAGDDAAALAAAQRFSSDPTERERIRALFAPPLDVQLGWADGTASASPAVLAQVATDLSTAGDDPARPGAQLARRHLEWPPAPAGALGLGAKGGSLPGVLTETFVLRRSDGTVGTAVLMARGMDVSATGKGAWATAVGSFAHQELLLQALQDPDTLSRLDCALAAT